MGQLKDPTIPPHRQETAILQYVLRFDGSDDYVQVDNPPNPTDAITVSMLGKK